MDLADMHSIEASSFKPMQDEMDAGICEPCESAIDGFEPEFCLACDGSAESFWGWAPSFCKVSFS